MRKTILTLLGLALLVTATVQFAAAAQSHQGHTVHRAPVTTGQFRRRLCRLAPAGAARLVALFGRLLGACRALTTGLR